MSSRKTARPSPQPGAQAGQPVRSASGQPLEGPLAGDGDPPLALGKWSVLARDGLGETSHRGTGDQCGNNRVENIVARSTAGGKITVGAQPGTRAGHQLGHQDVTCFGILVPLVLPPRKAPPLEGSSRIDLDGQA